MARALPPSAGGLLSYFTRHRTAANLLLVVLLMAGLFAVPNMRAQFFPDVIVDNVTVSARWDGAGAEDVDTGIVQILEPALMVIEGIESTSSSSFEGRASISLEFEPGWDMARAAGDVQDAVDAVTNLPEGIDDPTVRRGAWRDRVTDVVITGPVDPEQIANFADELVVRLFQVGVTRTVIRGVVAPRMTIEVPSVNLIANDVTMADIAAAIAAEVDANPAGDVRGANARVRTGSQKRTVSEIAAITLRTRPDGSTLTIGDVASVRLEGSTRARQYFVGADPAVSIRVDRSGTGDAITMQTQVEGVVAELQSTLPRGVSAELIRTRAEAISGRLNILVDNGLMGLGLVVALLFLFLNARTAFWVAAGIPVAMLAAVALMYLGGLTINMISLFGLIITLGIVVDDAIVVGEHADYRARTLGEPPVVAAENAARRMAMPVFAATITTVIAFFGLVVVGGRFGDLIQDIPFTVIAVLAASLVECFLILPNHMSHALAAVDKKAWYDWPSRTVNKGFDWVKLHLFRPLMAGVIWARYAVVAGVIVILSTQVTLFIEREVQWRFFNAPERGSVTGNFVMVDGATRADSIDMMREMQRAVEELAGEYEAEYGRNPVDYVLSEVGGNAGRGLSGTDNKDADQLGGISIELIDADLRPYSSFAFVGDLQDRVARHPLVEQVSFRGWRSGPGGDALDVQFFGATADILKQAAEDLKRAVAQYPEVTAVEDNLAYDKEELLLQLTPQGQALGLTVTELARVLRNRLAGIEAASFPEGARSADIRVELPEQELTADFLERTQLRTPSGSYVPLADVVSVQSRTGFSTVKRENGLRLISVTGDISEDDPARATEIQRALEEDILPEIAQTRQVEWRLAGLSEQEDQFLSDAQTGLTMVLVGIYLALAWVFSSWSRPAVVMAIIPFGLVGTIYGHYTWDVPLSMFTVVGLLGMTGIIINDSIVLITTIDQYRQERGLFPSIIDGAADRLRPVLLTTLTTVLGLVPLLYETSSQALWLKPTVITLVYGLGFGMFLVLLVVPALMAMQHDVAQLVASMRKSLKAHRARGLRALMLGLWALVLGWGSVTMGASVVFGQLPSAMADRLPAVFASGAFGPAFALFLIGVAALCCFGYVLGFLSFSLRQKSTPV
ncbi:MAG: efflux RND transporter permease subunit [Paracoccaceae bacterium]